MQTIEAFHPSTQIPAGMSLPEYFKNLLGEEVNLWLARVGCPNNITDCRTKSMTYRNHQTLGFNWSADLPGGKEQLRGWMSLDGIQFEVDQRPDQ